MDYRIKCLKSLDKNNRYMPLEKEEKQKLDNSYIQKILQNSNSNKMPKTNVINLSSYNENVPNYKMSITDMLAIDENKQKTLYYVVQRRNEKKNLKKNIIAIKDDRNFINKSNNVYNTNPKFFSKNNTDYSSNRNAINLRHNISRNNEYICNNGKKLTYQYFIDKRNKPYVSPILKNEKENNMEKNYCLNYHNNLNNYNKSTNKVKDNNYERKIFLKSLNNGNNVSHDVSPYSFYNNTNYNSKVNEKFRKYQINPNNKDYSSSERIQKDAITLPVQTKLRKSVNVQINLVNKKENKSLFKQSYDSLPFNLNKNVSIYYSRYSKKKDNKNNENENKYTPKIMFKDFRNFRITKNSIQLKNDYKLKNYKTRKNREKIIEINLTNEMANLELSKKNNIKFKKK